MSSGAPGAEHVASLRELKKADTRTRLSVAAVELLVCDGAEGATVSAIAERAGVSTRTFHNYFARREDAFLHFIREQVAQWADQAEDAPADESPLRILHGLLRESCTRTDDDLVAPSNLVLLRERIGFLMGLEGRPKIEDTLGPLYESVRQRIPDGTLFHARLMVDLGLAASGSALRQCANKSHDDDGPTLADLLDEAFEVLERGLGT